MDTLADVVGFVSGALLAWFGTVYYYENHPTQVGPGYSGTIIIKENHH